MIEDAVIYLLRLFRLAAIFFAFYLAEAVLSGKYVVRSWVQNKEPPRLVELAVRAIMIENIIFWCVLFVTSMLLIQTKEAGRRDLFFFDDAFLLTIIVDYFIVTILLVAVAYVLAAVISNRPRFRYGDDGLRSIRSYADMMKLASVVILAIPFYKMVL